MYILINNVFCHVPMTHFTQILQSSLFISFACCILRMQLIFWFLVWLFPDINEKTCMLTEVTHTNSSITHYDGNEIKP